MIYEGKIQDGKTIAAIMAYAAAKKGGMGKHLDL
jgi:ADP-ribose pyrophosphatase